MQERDEYGSLFHPEFMENLQRIIEDAGAKIVISSSWRLDGLRVMQEMWKLRGYVGEIIDCTPSLALQRGGGIKFWNDKLDRHPTEKIHGYSIPRGCEIQYWLDNESSLHDPIESYVILDDETDFLMHHKGNFVRCSENRDHDDCIDIGYGLTKKCAEEAIRILLKKE